METLFFAFQSEKTETKTRGRARQGTAAVGGFTLITPSEPVMSLLRNALKEIIRFVHRKQAKASYPVSTGSQKKIIIRKQKSV